jgi:ectoine hydroxylase-related dioxygenase (phytanoyl-CoA dioxygenase family)
MEVLTRTLAHESSSVVGMVDVVSGEYNPHLSYSCVNGKISTSLLGVSVVLEDHNPGDGGFCVVRGSHKSNFAAPSEFIDGDAASEFVYQPVTKAGDVVMFSEGTVHGTLPWMSERERRVGLYRFSPATVAYGRSYLTNTESLGWPPGMIAGMSEAEAAVIVPPYTIRLDRKVLRLNEDSKTVEVASHERDRVKKDFDKQVFGVDYF